MLLFLFSNYHSGRLLSSFSPPLFDYGFSTTGVVVSRLGAEVEILFHILATYANVSFLLNALLLRYIPSVPYITFSSLLLHGSLFSRVPGEFNSRNGAYRERLNLEYRRVDWRQLSGGCANFRTGFHHRSPSPCRRERKRERVREERGEERPTRGTDARSRRRTGLSRSVGV